MSTKEMCRMPPFLLTQTKTAPTPLVRTLGATFVVPHLACLPPSLGV